ncbi:hypothetical protein G6F42_023569 [Rhizopus arrhizus]|nr:hypothetical protein G6F42_023569 [Rhizopus arrhizus]
MKLSTFQRRDIEKDIDTSENQVQDISSSASKSMSYIVHQDGPNYIYEQVMPESMVTYEISYTPEPSFVYAMQPAGSVSSSEPPQTTPAAENKVQISDDDFYFSQTDSYSVPDLASFPADSPFIRDWPEIPDEAPPKIGLPTESSISV